MDRRNIPERLPPDDDILRFGTTTQDILIGSFSIEIDIIFTMDLPLALSISSIVEHECIDSK
jgi:hypothetical protein